GRQGGMIISSASSISYALLFAVEYYRIILPLSSSLVADYKYTTGYLFIRIFVHLLSFYLVALIASFVVERERRVSSLLVERESAFAQLDLLHKSIIESVEAGIVIINLSARIKLFNRAAEEITGYGNREVLNRRIELLFPRYEEIRQGLTKHTRSSRQVRGEVEFMRKDDSAISLGIAISPLRNSEGVKIGEILIFQDLTWSKMMEESLEKNRRLAFVGEMAAGLAHEIRNPLAAISGSVQMLNKSHFLSKKDQRLMEIVVRGKDQIENFMKDFLLLARPAPGMDESVNIRELLEDVLESLRMTPEWPEKCEVELALHQGVVVRAKKMEIRQVLWNLILNAIQSMPEGGRLTIEVTVSEEKPSEGFWDIKISDTGVGIEDDVHSLIMEPFYTTKERGTGLGLAIVNRIVARSSGTIRIESKSGQGTTFIVSFPYVHPGESDEMKDHARG
ncbi:MAG: ATP-binding protein, partial [Smithellaceae bacterium]|nr:ATP-binding protein [Smithellaceae bacterium]